MTRKLLKAVALSLVFVLASPLAFFSSCAKQAPPRYFIALGDSISSGFGLPGYSPGANQELLEGRHTSLLFEKMIYGGLVDEYLNKAVSGLDTSGLLGMLTNMDDDALQKFSYARVITINIGGNNILTPFLGYLDEVVSGVDVEELMSGALLLFEALQVFGGMFGRPGDGGEEEGAGTQGLLPGLLVAVFGIRAIFGSGTGVYSTLMELFSILLGSLPPDLMDALEEGVESFTTDLYEILDWLYENAPKATIIVNTVYNPIPREFAGIYAPISTLACSFIEKMNDAIARQSERMSLVVVDLYSHLSDRIDLSQLNLDIESGSFSYDIIHPSAEGHRLIAELQHYYFILFGL